MHLEEQLSCLFYFVRVNWTQIGYTKFWGRTINEKMQFTVESHNIKLHITKGLKKDDT